jgi:DnaJ-class molecular chaperone
MGFLSNGSTIMTAGFRVPEPNRAYCANCKGKGFDLTKKSRHASRCQRCRGKGFTTVGNTKR